MAVKTFKLPSFDDNNTEETTIDNVGRMLTNIVRLQPQQQSSKTKIDVNPNDGINLFLLDRKIRGILDSYEDKDALDMYKRATKGIMSSYSLLSPYREFDVYGEKQKTNTSDKETQKKCHIDAFIECAKRFVEIVVKTRDDDYSERCDMCDDLLEIRGQMLWCDNCKTMKKSILEQDTSNIETVSARNMGDKLAHFRTIVVDYQGKGNYDISVGDIEKIKNYAKKYSIDIKKMSKDTLSHILERTGLKDELDTHLSLLHKTLTGIPAPDISHIEERIYGRHQEVIMMFYKIKTSERKHALKPWYLFYQYLIAEEFVVDQRDFPMLKMRDTLSWHNTTYKKIIEALKGEKSTYNWTMVDVSW
jgi:hypothetical protein